jgi:resolvase-like protein
MERPGLKKLLDDIAAKRVDTVVVYKVDRLTRSLADFAKIVEQFDKQVLASCRSPSSSPRPPWEDWPQCALILHSLCTRSRKDGGFFLVGGFCVFTEGFGENGW